MGKYIFISIECAPGRLLPDAYILKCAEFFNLSKADIPPTTSHTFGKWVWYIPCSITKKDYDVKEVELFHYFEKLYEDGLIYGADWDLVDRIPGNDEIGKMTAF